MNNIEQHVTSLDLSRRLAGLGVNIKSHFIWFPEIAYAHQEYLGDVGDEKGEMTEEEDARMPIYESKVMSVNENKWYVSCDEKEEYRQPTYPAYLASELAEMLPMVFEKNGELYYLSINPSCWSKEDGITGWCVTYSREGFHDEIFFDEKSLPEALGLMLAHLLETGAVGLRD